MAGVSSHPLTASSTSTSSSSLFLPWYPKWNKSIINYQSPRLQESSGIQNKDDTSKKRERELYIQFFGGASKIGCIICYNFGKDNQELSFIPGQLPLLTNSCPVLFCILSTFQPFSPSEIYFTDAILISTDICGRAMPGFLISALHIYVHIQPQRHCYQSALIFL